ncbi:MAG: glycosyltransferase [Planctomycetaceae bacterium]|nr:glycosyltransferase [Planctomycetaceae bacterium]
MSPKISIIIPVYNVEAYLRQCMDSVVNQTMRDIQIICINDGSTDGSRAILQEYADQDSRIEIIDKPNGGQSSARNAAYPSIQGKYTLFVDSDDWIDLKTCENTYYYAEQTQADFVHFQRYHYKQLTSSLTPSPQKGSLLFYDTPEQKKRFLTSKSHSACQSLYRTDFLRRHSLRFPEGLVHEDSLFFWQAVTRAERIAFLPGFFYYYRQRPFSTVTSFGENRLGIFQIYALIEEDLRTTGNYPLYQDEFIATKIRECMKIAVAIRPEFRQKANQMFLERLGEAEIDYLKTKAAPRYRDYYLSLTGNRMAWCRHSLRQAFRSVVSVLREAGRFFFIGRKNKPENEQLLDLVCQLSRELVELREARSEEYPTLKRAA